MDILISPYHAMYCVYYLRTGKEVSPHTQSQQLIT
jgi:hypothetical protein